MEYYLGIDSGGTKTQFTMADRHGNIAGSARMGTTHYQQCGFNGVVENLNTGIDELLQTSGINLSDIKHVFLGLAAYDEIQADMDEICNAVDEGLYHLPHSIGGDNICSWAGSLAGKSGASVVAGTGSIAYARNRKGDSARCGGWGHWFGGDEGSAYWIGTRLALAFTRQSDGRDPKTLLYSMMQTNYHLIDDFDILDLMTNQWEMDRSKVATLSKFAYELACQEDPVARAIFKDAGKALSEIVNACVCQVEFDEKIYASYTGGVFKSGELILGSLRENLLPQIELVPPRFGPDVGGIILAMMADNIEITDSIRRNLK